MPSICVSKNYNTLYFILLPCPVSIVKLPDILNSLNMLTIRKLILEMKDSSITNADCLPSKLLKMCPEVFANLFYPLFASILLTRIYPDVWKVAYVRPLHKRGPRNIISNYRDNEKACNKVPHSILLSQLFRFGLDSDLVDLLRSYFSDRIQHVKIENFFSDAIHVVSGVPQGSVLGPLLILLLINDLHSIFLDSVPWLFADGLKVLFTSLNFHNDLSRLWNWNIANGMIANLDKTKCLAIKGQPIVFLGSTEALETVKLHKDLGLGLYFSNDLKWVINVEIQLNKARRVFYALKSRIPSNTPSRTKFNLYRRSCSPSSFMVFRLGFPTSQD